MEPAWRGGSGSALLSRTLTELRRLGVAYVLTFADDRGSGKLREWYMRHGFVDAEAFTETAMAAKLLND